MTTPAETADALRATSFLEGFTDAHLWKLSRLVTPLTLVPDDSIFSEGEARQRFAILISGAVAIEKSSDGRTTRLVTLGAGEAVGEGLLLDDSAHGTTARVIMPGIAMVLARAQLDDITRESPQLDAALVARAARAISARLRRAARAEFTVLEIWILARRYRRQAQWSAKSRSDAGTILRVPFTDR